MIMTFIQRRGPFDGVLVFKPEGPIKLTYLQIGIESPHSIPISEFEDNDFSFTCSINGKNYLVTERDVLEFSNLSLETISVTFVKPNNPYLIVNVAYEEAN
jgi:hypothetical protein